MILFGIIEPIATYYLAKEVNSVGMFLCVHVYFTIIWRCPEREIRAQSF